VPIPKEKGDDESGMRVGPERIEIHVNRQRAGPPDGESGEEGPALFYVLSREAEGEEQTEKTVECGGEGHGEAIGSGKTVGGDRGAEGAGE